MNALQEFAQVFEFGLCGFLLCLEIHDIAEIKGVLRGADQEGRIACARNFIGNLDFAERSHLGYEGIVGTDIIFAHNGERKYLAGRNVLLRSCAAHAGNYAFHGFELGNEGFVSAVRGFDGLRRHHNALAGAAFCQMLPQFFGNEGHEGVQEVKQVVEETERGTISCRIDRGLVRGFHHFEVPRGEFIPEETVHFHEGFGNAVLREQICDGGSAFAELRSEPFGGLQ